MQIKLPYDSSKPISGEASIEIDKPLPDVFDFIGTHFFENYPKWAVEVIHFEPLDGYDVFVGARAKQTRKDYGDTIESVFEIVDFQPDSKLAFQGVTGPYKNTYLLDSAEQTPPTRLTFRFELLELELFMRPFQKLIRAAIEEGAENMVGNIKELLSA